MITALFHRHREKQMDMDAELWIQLDTLPSLRFTAFRGEGGAEKGISAPKNTFSIQCMYLINTICKIADKR